MGEKAATASKLAREGLDFAVLGDPIEHSLSPQMHTAGFRAAGLAHRYTKQRVSLAELGDALSRHFEVGTQGLNLTVPLKRKALDFVDELSPGAAEIGAVNTLVRGAHGWVGHNTDAPGFVRALQQLGPEAPRRAVLLGSGGAAQAVVAGLLGAYPELQLTVVSRRPETCAFVGIARVSVCDYAQFATRADTADLWVNTTTVGMKGGPREFPRPLDLERLLPRSRVIDIVYPRPPGGLLDRAEAAGHATQDGKEMLLWQGVVAQELWLGLDALSPESVAQMRAALG